MYLFKHPKTEQHKTYINFWSFGKGAHWMHMVIEYDDTHHYPQTEWYCFLICKPASVLPEILEHKNIHYYIKQDFVFNTGKKVT